MTDEVNDVDFQYADATSEILHYFYKVYNTLGHGFLETVYHKAMYIELLKAGFKVESQKPIKVYYEGELVGDYYADLVVDDIVILELKAAEAIRPEHELQLLNYLKATEMEVGLLLNFGKVPQIRRKAYTKRRRERR